MSKQLFFYCFLIGFIPKIAAQKKSFLQRQIERALAYENRTDSLKTTGLLIGCIDHDSTWVFPYGNLAKGNGSKGDTSLYFEIGSVTQTFTAANIETLAQKGILNYDSTVNTYLKPEQRFPLGNKMTLLNLLTHTSGLPKFPNDWGEKEIDKEQPYANYTEADFFQFLKTQDSTDWRQGQYLFSNLNFALVGKVLDNFGQGVLEWNPFVNKSSVPLAQGHNLVDRETKPWIVAPVFKNAIGGCANMSYLLTFTRQQLNIGTGDKNSILSATQKPFYPAQTNKSLFVGKGWHTQKEKKYFPICMASGASNGHSAVIVFVPQTQTAVIILANSRAIRGDLAVTILHILNDNGKRKN